jgi:hypothetical protein
MRKHTLGPWEAGRNSVHTGQIAVIHGCLNSDWVEVWSPNAYTAGFEEMEANARIVIAAPTMYDLIAATAVNYNPEQPSHVLVTRLYELQCQAINILAKIEGGNNE